MEVRGRGWEESSASRDSACERHTSHEHVHAQTYNTTRTVYSVYTLHTTLHVLHTTLHVQCTVYLAYNGEHEPGSLVNEGVNVTEQATSHIVSEREGEGGEKGRTDGERRLLGGRGEGLPQSGSETQPGAGS